MSALAACDPASNGNARLVVSIDTDMALPTQIDTVHVQVQADHVLVHDQNYSVGATNMVPATLSILPGEQPGQAVTVRVWGLRGTRLRTFREVATTMPIDRAALLRMPLQWLCDQTARLGNGSEVSGASGLQPQVTSTCGEGQTCVDGKCMLNQVDASTLPDYTPEAVFGGAADPLQGSCFDTVACMIPGQIVEPDAKCTIAKPAQGSPNIGLRVTDDGICDDTGSLCFVPLDNASEGWSLTEAGDRIALPLAVCKKLQDRSVGGVYLSTACGTKVPGVPPCGAWSSVPPDRAVVPQMPSMAAGPKLVTTLLPDGRSGVPCCPLLADAGKLYTCMCASRQSATVFSIDPNQGGASRNVGYASPPAERQNMSFSAALLASTLYWSADTSLARTPLASSTATSMVNVPGSIYETASLLVDASATYALASGVDDTMGAPVRLLAIPNDDQPVRILDTGANRPVFQFDQDGAGVYLASDVDAANDEGSAVDRTSSVVRIDKASGERTVIIPERQLTIRDSNRSGFVGVQVDSEHKLLFALFESAPAADGGMTVQLQKVDLATASQPSAPSVVYEARISPGLTKITLLGAIDSSAVLLRTDYSGGVVNNNQLFAVPGAVRILASFGHDRPLESMAHDAKSIYWLNNSGRLYALPRAALR